MTNKLNLLAIEKYSKSFAAKVCDGFYANNEVIDGKQLLSLTNFQQVNLLIIRALYEKWQAENQRLRSPYFDYGNAEVQAGLKQFMNTLSQFILIKREALEPLLVKATQETFWLVLQPHKFFSETFRDLPNFRLTSEDIGRLAKYVQINKNLIPPLTEKLGGREFVFANQAIDWLDEIIAKTSLEDSEKYMQLFSETLSVPEEILPKRQPEIINNSYLRESAANHNGSFFDKLGTAENYEPRNRTAVFEPIVVPDFVRPKAEPKPEIQEPVLREDPKIIVPEPPKIEFREDPKAFQEVPKVAVKEAEVRVNERFGSEQKTLNDQTVNGTTVFDLHKNRRIEDIRHAISLNQRFLFINHLFAGNAEAFTNAIQELGVCQNFPEAKEVLLKKYVPKYFWDITSAEAEEFIDIVRRRFN